jgi:hypothetical protein
VWRDPRRFGRRDTAYDAEMQSPQGAHTGDRQGEDDLEVQGTAARCTEPAATAAAATTCTNVDARCLGTARADPLIETNVSFGRAAT